MGRTTRCSGFRFLVDFGLFVGPNPIQAHRESWILLASESVSTSVFPPLVHQDSKPVTSSSRLSLDQYKLICCNGFAVLSDAAKVFVAMTVALTGLEFLVAFLQAYVFTVLTCMYLNDAIHPGH